MLNRLILLTVYLTFAQSGYLFAQKGVAEPRVAPAYIAGAQSTVLVVDDEKHGGYITEFHFPEKILEKGWWKYLSKTARVKDRKTYWILTVPPEKGESTQPLIMYSSIKKTGNTSSLALTLNTSQMDDDARKDYMTQTKNFLLEFKAKFYRDHVQELIKAAEKQARSVSRKQQKYHSQTAKAEKALSKERLRKGEDVDLSTKAAKLTSKAAAAKAEAERLGTQLEKIQADIDQLKRALLSYIEKGRK